MTVPKTSQSNLDNMSWQELTNLAKKAEGLANELKRKSLAIF